MGTDVTWKDEAHEVEQKVLTEYSVEVRRVTDLYGKWKRTHVGNAVSQ